MLTLDLTNAPRWHDLAPGVRVQLRPLTTALMVAARADPALAALPDTASSAEGASMSITPSQWPELAFAARRSVSAASALRSTTGIEALRKLASKVWRLCKPVSGSRWLESRKPLMPSRSAVSICPGYRMMESRISPANVSDSCSAYACARPCRLPNVL